MITKNIFLLIITLAVCGFGETTDLERYLANKKPFWKALVVQVFCRVLVITILMGNL
jgi:hypothetical protein